MRLSAGGAKVSCFSSSLASRKASIGDLTRADAWTFGGTGRWIGRYAQWLRAASNDWPGSASAEWTRALMSKPLNTAMRVWIRDGFFKGFLLYRSQAHRETSRMGYALRGRTPTAVSAMCWTSCAGSLLSCRERGGKSCSESPGSTSNPLVAGLDYFVAGT